MTSYLSLLLNGHAPTKVSTGAKSMLLVSVLAFGAWISAVCVASFGMPGSALAQDRGLDVRVRADPADRTSESENVRLYFASHALVVGNDEYTNGWPRLSGATKDAREVASALVDRGFNVTLKLNLDSVSLKSELEEFFVLQGADPNARLFVWFAGHGHTLDGEGFLVPTDAPLPDSSSAARFKISAVPMRRFGEYVRLAVSKHVLAIFDSCFAGTIFDSQRALPPAAITRATTLPARQFLTSGDAGQTVSDDGTFRTLFLRGLNGEERADANDDGYVTASELGLYLSNRVTNLTQGRQTPRYGSLRDANFDRGDFVFAALHRPETAVVVAPPTSGNGIDSATEVELEFWRSIKDSENPADFSAFVDQFPGSPLARLARNRLATLDKSDAVASAPGAAVPPTPRPQTQVAAVAPPPRPSEVPQIAPAPSPAPTPAPSRYRAGETIQDCSICPELTVIKAGRFEMGTPPQEEGRLGFEGPLHTVAIARDFAIGVTEVTFSQYDACVSDGGCGRRPQDYANGRGSNPVIDVSWLDARAYVEWLSRRTGARYRLPSESEWEYAARAGTRTSRHWGEDPVETCRYANVADTAPGRDPLTVAAGGYAICDDRWQYLAPVGTMRPNAFGLYDMFGNVWEWIEDCWYPSYADAPTDGSARVSDVCETRVLRGGSWLVPPALIRSGMRDHYGMGQRNNAIGFRIARDLD